MGGPHSRSGLLEKRKGIGIFQCLFSKSSKNSIPVGCLGIVGSHIMQVTCFGPSVRPSIRPFRVLFLMLRNCIFVEVDVECLL